jgi:hypothetical protein
MVDSTVGYRLGNVVQSTMDGPTVDLTVDGHEKHRRALGKRRARAS